MLRCVTHNRLCDFQLCYFGFSGSASISRHTPAVLHAGRHRGYLWQREWLLVMSPVMLFARPTKLSHCRGFPCLVQIVFERRKRNVPNRGKENRSPPISLMEAYITQVCSHGDPVGSAVCSEAGPHFFGGPALI